MRNLGTVSNAYLTEVAARNAKLLMRIDARDRSTGADDPVFLWTGSMATAFTIGGATHVYEGNGAIVKSPDISRAKGLDVRRISTDLSRKHPAVIELLDVRDPRHVRIQIHRALFSLETGALIEEPHLVFDGFFDEPSAQHGAGGGDTATCKLSPITDQLTKVLPLNYADETARLNGGDRILKYAAISGQATVYWGEKKAVGN